MEAASKVFKCHKCGKKTMRRLTVQNHAAEWHGQNVVVPETTFNECSACKARSYDSAHIRNVRNAARAARGLQQRACSVCGEVHYVHTDDKLFRHLDRRLAEPTLCAGGHQEVLD